MNSSLYIPKKIKVGFQKRQDTFSKMLAYIIYYDDKGKLRKETSWENWRDKTIDAHEYDNVPQSGLIINKDIKRYNWSHFSSRKTMIRVYDSRGFEFEITTENLIGVLMHDDVIKRGLSGDYVYAWDGKELILLPCSSEEYTDSVKFTQLVNSKVSAKDLKEGFRYKTKQEETIVYLGKYNWYDYKKVYTANRNDYTTDMDVEKQRIYYNENGNKFFVKSGVTFIGEEIGTEIVDNYSELLSNFNKTLNSSKIKELKLVKANEHPLYNDLKASYYTIPGTCNNLVYNDDRNIKFNFSDYVRHNNYGKKGFGCDLYYKSKDKIHPIYITSMTDWTADCCGKKFNGYKFTYNPKSTYTIVDDKVTHKTDESYHYNSYNHTTKLHDTEKYVLDEKLKTFEEVFDNSYYCIAVLENGNEIILNDIDNIFKNL